MIAFEVDERAAGQRADRGLRIMAPGVDRAMAMRLLREGAISVNNGKATLKTVLSLGDAVTARVDPLLTEVRKPKVKKEKPAVRKTEMPAGYSVMYLDEHICVVNKPAGMATHPADGVEKGSTLLDATALYLKEKRITTERPPAAAGRLDRGTSGVVIMTLSREAEKGLAVAMEGDKVHKEYLALVHGVTQPKFEIDEPLLVSKYKRGESKTKKMKSAITRFVRLSFSKDATLVRALPETGRMHQIRRHLRSASHPIVGDGRYGIREDRHAERFFLHAEKVELPHPATGKALSFHAPLPKDFKQALRAHGVALPD